MDKYPVRYGDNFVGGELADRGTIHGSGTIDIQVDPVTREIRAVWFRCLNLPFRVSEAGGPVIQPEATVTAVEYLAGT
jgi:hypothetical protein